ncbi:MAG: protein TolQ [Endozoicomonadaceae bacterium]|nr:protein TolQ [Endozoicomonadaceae bacterium]
MNKVNGDSILILIMNANWIVQLIMLGLFIASLISWSYIFRNIRLLNNIKKADMQFEERFWSGIDITLLYQEQHQNPDAYSGIAKIFFCGFKAFSKLSGQIQTPEVIMESVQQMMRVAVSREQKQLDRYIPYLATLGSTAPYVGLLGTVIGVMNAFRGLAITQQATIAAVAPGIAEALIATAIGLFAAIPAVIAYNRFSSRIEQQLISYEVFSEEFSGILHRRLHLNLEKAEGNKSVSI